MGFGQYSAGGGVDRTKADMIVFAGLVSWARKGGKNRLHFKRPDGSQGFILHETVVAELSADGTRLTLADGGWHTPTTKSAWGDALRAFFPDARHFTPAEWGRDTHDGVRGYWYRLVKIDYPGRADRSVTYVRGDAVHHWVRQDVLPDLPMIRASTDDGNFAVRFDGSRIVSEAGADVRATPFKVLVVLGYIDALARATGGMRTLRGRVLDRFGFEAFGFTIHPGQSSRAMMIGCHTFKTEDIRAAFKRIAAEHPDAAARARRFVRRHPKDFGFAAYEAERRAAA